MSEEANADAGAGEQPEAAPNEAPKVVAYDEFTKVVGQRQDLKGKLRDQAAQLAEYQAREKEAADDKLREQGEYQKLLEQERAEKLDFKQKYEQRLYNEKFNSTVAAVSAKTGLDRVMTEALLLREKQVSGTEVALDELSDDSVTELAKALKLSAPSMFTTKGVGGSPTTPGLNMENKAEGEGDVKKARVRALARELSYQKPK